MFGRVKRARTDEPALFGREYCLNTMDSNCVPAERRPLGVSHTGAVSPVYEAHTMVAHQGLPSNLSMPVHNVHDINQHALHQIHQTQQTRDGE